MDSDTDTDDETSLTFRQLQHNHSQLMAEKKMMEEYFEQVDHEAQKKTNAISTLQSKLAEMKSQLAQAHTRKVEEQEEASTIEQNQEEERARRRRVLPKAPGGKRFAPGPTGRSEVAAVNTSSKTRDLLVTEIRSLESELGYTYEKSMKQDEEIEILKSIVDRFNDQPGGDSSGGAMGHRIPMELPSRSASFEEVLEDVLNAEGSAPTIISIVDGQPHSIIVNCRDILEQVYHAAVAFEELEERELVALEMTTENERLCDVLDEVQNELLAARTELRQMQEMMGSKGNSAVNPAGEGEGGNAAAGGESLADMFATAEAAGPSAWELQLQKKLNVVIAENAAMAKKMEKLENDLMDLREVHGFTIEEQIQMLSERIGLAIQIDELTDETQILMHENKKVQFELKSVHSYIDSREKSVYGLLEKPVKAKDRKKLLKILKETAMQPGGQPGAIGGGQVIVVPQTPANAPMKPTKKGKSATPYKGSATPSKGTGWGGSGGDAANAAVSTPDAEQPKAVGVVIPGGSRKPPSLPLSKGALQAGAGPAAGKAALEATAARSRSEGSIGGGEGGEGGSATATTTNRTATPTVKGKAARRKSSSSSPLHNGSGRPSRRQLGGIRGLFGGRKKSLSTSALPPVTFVLKGGGGRMAPPARAFPAVLLQVGANGVPPPSQMVSVPSTLARSTEGEAKKAATASDPGADGHRGGNFPAVAAASARPSVSTSSPTSATSPNPSGEELAMLKQMEVMNKIIATGAPLK